MKTTKLLLPNGLKRVGWWMIAGGAVLALVYGLAPDGTLCESWNDFRALFGFERLQTAVNNFSGFDAESNLVNTLIGVLLVVGWLLYHEALTWNKIVGIVICLAGLVFINLK